MYKIALVGLGLGVWLVPLEAAQAVTQPCHECSPIYEGRFGFAPAPGYSPGPTAIVGPYSHGGCFVTNNEVEEAKGVRHWSPWC